MDVLGKNVRPHCIEGVGPLTPLADAAAAVLAEVRGLSVEPADKVTSRPSPSSEGRAFSPGASQAVTVEVHEVSLSRFRCPEEFPKVVPPLSMVSEVESQLPSDDDRPRSFLALFALLECSA